MRVPGPYTLLTRPHLQLVMRLLFSEVPDATIEHVIPRSMYKLQPNCTIASRDMHNLMMLPRELNSRRGSLPFGSRRAQPDPFWRPLAPFGAWTNARLRLYEPPPSHRGLIARKILYFRAAYPEISVGNRVIDDGVLQQWLEEQPVMEGERYADLVIQALQGNSNPWVTSD